MNKSLHLVLFPLVELISFFAALHFLNSNFLISLGFLFVAGLALNFSVHITFHEVVHSTGRFEPVWLIFLSYLATLFLGFPFDGYRWHHYNHHRYDNDLQDYSSTWSDTSQGRRPKNWFLYVLGWPRQIVRGRADLKTRVKNGTAPLWLKNRIDREKYFLALFYLTLLVFSIKAFALYLLLTYLGWAFVTLHNYGQHLPLPNEKAHSTSYQGLLYNKIFCNNGIHFEHHTEPHIPWHELLPDPDAPKIVELPHLAGPLFSLTDSLKNQNVQPHG